MLKKERIQRFTIVFANLKCLDSRKIALLAFIIATAAAMSRCLWDLRRSRRICRISVRMNIAGNLREDGMMRSRATSLVGEIGEPCMEWNISFKGSVSFFIEGQRKRWMLESACQQD